MNWKTRLRLAVEGNWNYHRQCGSIHWREYSNNFFASPVRQEVYGGKDDGKAVSVPFDFNLSGFGNVKHLNIWEAELYSHNSRARTCPLLLIDGSFELHEFRLILHLDPCQSEPVEMFDVIHHCICPLLKEKDE